MTINPLESNKTSFNPQQEVTSPLQKEVDATNKLFTQSIVGNEPEKQSNTLTEQHQITKDIEGSHTTQNQQFLDTTVKTSRETGNEEVFNSESVEPQGWLSWILEKSKDLGNTVVEFVEKINQPMMDAVEPHTPEDEYSEDFDLSSETDEEVDNTVWYDPEELHESTKPEEQQSYFTSMCESISDGCGAVKSFGLNVGSSILSTAQDFLGNVKDKTIEVIDSIGDHLPDVLEYTENKAKELTDLAIDGANFAKTFVVNKATTLAIDTLDSLNKIDIDSTKKKLKEQTGSDIPFSSINALIESGMMKKMGGRTTSAKDEAIKTALEHPYVNDLVLEVSATATQGLYQQLGELQGDKMANIAISILKDINSQPESKQLSQEEQAQQIKQRNEQTTKILMDMVLPNGIDSLPISKEACEKLDKLSDSYNSVMTTVNVLQMMPIESEFSIREEIYNLVQQRMAVVAENINKTISDPVFHKEVTISILKDMHREVDSGFVPKLENPANYLSRIAYSEKQYLPSQDMKQEMSKELQTFTLSTLKDVVEPGVYATLTNKHIGIFKENGLLLNHLSNKVGSAILTKLGSIDMKQTPTNMLKRATEKSIPEGHWQGEEFIYDKKAVQERIEFNRNKPIEVKPTIDREQTLKNLDAAIEELTSDEAVKVFINGAMKTGSKMLNTNMIKYMEGSKIISKAFRLWTEKASSRISAFLEKKLPSIVEGLFKTNVYTKTKSKTKELIDKVPTISTSTSTDFTRQVHPLHKKK